MALGKTEGGARYLVVKTQNRLHVLNERCPHQGYPLSQGTMHNGELTCAWHNWKFDVCTGACPQGDSLPRWPNRLHEGRVQADLSIDLEAERAADQVLAQRSGYEASVLKGEGQACQATLHYLHEGVISTQPTRRDRSCCR